MKISIIVPMYNSKKTIDKLIRSVENQTYDNYELILVDDGSTDKTYEYIKDNYNNKKIKLYKKKNSGPGLSRKYGFNKSDGEIIFFVDSDDFIKNSNVFQIIIDTFKNDIDLLFFDREEIYDGNKKTIKAFNYIKCGINKIDDINEKIIPGLGSKIFKRSILKKEMFYNSNIFEDLYTTYLYMDKCKTFYYINKSLYVIYHDSEIDSLSTKIDFARFEQSLEIITKIYDILRSEVLRKTLEDRIVSLFTTYLITREYKKNVNKKIIKKITILLDSNRKYYYKSKLEKYTIIDYVKIVYIFLMIKKYKNI